jgi:hypothetical protein
MLLSFHQTQSLDKHTKHLISLEYQDQHKALCYEYKIAIVARVAMLMFDMLQFNVGGIPHTKHLISLEYKDQHKALCYKYKNAILQKVDARYATIQCWWYSSY